MKKWIELLTVALLALGLQGAWAADEDVAWFREHLGQMATPLPTGVSVEVDETSPAKGEAALKVHYDGVGPVSITLIEVDDPGLENCMLLYEAWIRSEDVQAPAYVEMLCAIGSGEFFSRALNQAVEGTTEWKKTQTPFRLELGQRPSRVKLGIRMEGPGTVWVDEIRMQPVSPWSGYGVAPGALWGAIGAALGVLAGVWGILAGTLAARGQARAFVLGYGVVLWACCVVLLVEGIVLAATGRAYALWFPCLLCGAIGTALFSLLVPLVQYRYRQAEARRMAAMDLTDSM